MAARIAMAAAAAVLLAAPAPAAGRYDWDALGAEFCRVTLTGDLQGMRPILTGALYNGVAAVAAGAEALAVRALFQSYSNPVPVCEAETLNAAIIEVRRSDPGRGALAWREWLVVVPEADGTTRIDDVLFATRRSDTLRARLGIMGIQ
jgi:hypothetical protein